MSQFVAPTGYVELDNDCEYSIDRKSTRSREEVNPKEDLAFYFNTYIVPKYGLNNINVSNVASFMKELEMNWTKLNPESRSKTMDILVDGILNRDTTFKSDLMARLNIQQQPQGGGGVKPGGGKSRFGSSSPVSAMSNNKIIVVVVVLVLMYFFFIKKPFTNYGRLS
jgi:hypothetical protein